MSDILERIRDHAFFVSYGGGHAAAIAPVAAQLAESSIPVRLLGLTTAAHYLAQRGLPVVTMKDMVGASASYSDCLDLGRKLAAGQAHHSLIAPEDTAAYLGVGYLGLQRTLEVHAAAELFDRLGRQAFRPVEFFEEVFSNARPSIVISTNSPRSERAALEAARNLQIPSICIVDLFAAFEIEWCASKNYASRVCVLNEAVRSRFIERGVPPERVIATGNPAFDRIAEVDVSASRSSHRARLGLSQDDRLLVWISQPEAAVHPFSGKQGDPTLPARIESELAASFANDPQVHIVLRMHPSEDRTPLVSGPRMRVGTIDESLDDLLCAADCVVTCSSTVGIEAAMLGAPVVQINASIFSPDLPLGEMGYATGVRDVADAIPAIRQCFMTERNIRSEVPGGSAERVAQIVRELIG